MQESLPKHNIVLLGAGHTNTHIIRMWRMNPLPDAQLVCVSNFGITTYSGMLPGTLAGQYVSSQMQIDLVRLCASAGVRLIREEVVGLDVEERKLLLADRPPLNYDILSVGVGSLPTTVSDVSEISLSIKPMQTFVERLETRLARLVEQRITRPWRITVAGAGAAGVEIVLCLARRLDQSNLGEKPLITLIDRGAEILKGMPSRTRQLAHRELSKRGIQLLLNQQIVDVDDRGHVISHDGSTYDCDLLLWATSASSPLVLDRLGLPMDDAGFLLTRSTLQSVGSDMVFAVGDSGTCEYQPQPKAGVHAVRQSPVLWQNMRRLLNKEPLLKWKPQRSFLTILNTGDDRAILTYKGFSVHARWCMNLKDRIDRRFMAKYQDYPPPMKEPPANQSDLGETMYCGGCGCKVEASMLERVLRKLDNLASPHVLVGLDKPDDVAVLQNSTGHAIAATADFFTAFLDDPFVLGRIAALNALSDMYAKGAKSLGALALCSLPHGPSEQQEDFLLQLLAGSLTEFRPAGVPLVGGHTIESLQTTVGFTILGEINNQAIPIKGNLQQGDHLVLTKSLGTGILLAAHRRAMCRCDWMDALMESMLSSNQRAGTVAKELQLRAVTDVTGYGLAGHLLEMLRASGVSAELSLNSLPLLPGVTTLSALGIESTLAPGNRATEPQLKCTELVRSDDRFTALFDPQTSGGLLMGVAANQLGTLLKCLDGTGTVIGRVLPSTAGQSTMHIVEHCI